MPEKASEHTRNGPADRPDSGSKGIEGRFAATPTYDAMRDLAERYLSAERKGHTLQPTALVHEAYLRLLESRRIESLDAQEFLFAVGGAMRCILVDHARKRGAAKRGGGAARVPLDDAVIAYEQSGTNLVSLDDALSRLGAMDEDLARLVELRFFGGMTEEQVAIVLGVSARTVRRSWHVAKMWLANALTEGDAA